MNEDDKELFRVIDNRSKDTSAIILIDKKRWAADKVSFPLQEMKKAGLITPIFHCRSYYIRGCKDYMLTYATNSRELSHTTDVKGIIKSMIKKFVDHSEMSSGLYICEKFKYDGTDYFISKGRKKKEIPIIKFLHATKAISRKQSIAYITKQYQRSISQSAGDQLEISEWDPYGHNIYKLNFLLRADYTLAKPSQIKLMPKVS